MFIRFSQECINPGNAPFLSFPNGEIKNFVPQQRKKSCIKMNTEVDGP